MSFWGKCESDIFSCPTKTNGTSGEVNQTMSDVQRLAPSLLHLTLLYNTSHYNHILILLNTHHHSPTYMYTPHSISMIEIEKQQNNNLVSSFQDFWGYKRFKGFFLERKHVYMQRALYCKQNCGGSDRKEREQGLKIHNIIIRLGVFECK